MAIEILILQVIFFLIVNRDTEYFSTKIKLPFLSTQKGRMFATFLQKNMYYMCEQYHLVFKTMLFIPRTLCTWLVLDTCFLLVHEGENVWLNTNVKRYDIMYTLSEKTTLQQRLEKAYIRYKNCTLLVFKLILVRPI